ncbi:class F sortase [Gordonia sp. PDNC005]|uniref:class F sortase n=1 Tax=unclassified Gordonia (in: high G+C Gram-positive bacteria) TaxID=2657482 RepID=UPI001965894F|nr:class F sortase [Gordonia sp. PDNC005]QRY62508.1 class F sortase [Gordonia sp. PDNC005]
MERDDSADRPGAGRGWKIAIGAVIAAIVLAVGALALGGVFGGGAEQNASVPTTPVIEQPTVVPPKASGGIVPARLTIPSLKMNAVVEPKGTVMEYAKFLGHEVPSFGIPEGMKTTTWWSDGPKPGSDGMAVVLGHTQVGGGYGVFNDIGKLRPGKSIVVASKKGTKIRFLVTKVVSGVSKSDPAALNKVLSRAPKGSGIALVTCGGQFDSAQGASEDNIIVFGELAG